MGLAESMMGRIRAAGRVLALLAALALAAGIHPPHAEAAPADAHHGNPSQATGLHSHLAVSCLQAELDHARDNGKTSLPGGHADCTMVCAPFVRPQAPAQPAFVCLALARPGDQACRHLASTFDPPPPRAV